jgi:D-beta-D-heptose 7-phosphate kinase/D-beta-D-heptose 1-phosphate adenosyltransferase
MAAGVVVGRLGTAAIAAQDLKTELFVRERTGGTHKILTLPDARTQMDRWKREGKSVGFTNGCFDLVHSGHLKILNQTKLHCDKLIVAVNSDASVKRLKGESRPINSEIERALLLASLSVVDMVIVFSEDTPMTLLEVLRPDVLVKGADYQKSQVVGHELVESYGGRVVLVPLKEGYSTTNLIRKMS